MAEDWAPSSRRVPAFADVCIVPTRADGQPAFGAYLRPRAGIRSGTGVYALALVGDQICAMTRFETNVMPWFGLPPWLPSS